MSDTSFLDRFFSRIYHFMFVLGVAGLIGAWFWKGPQAAAGFAGGTAFSIVNFQFLKRLTDRLGNTSAGKQGASVVFLALRYLILTAAGYAILKYSEIGFKAALVGCFVAVAAVFLELIYELIYGT